ncbi:radical SAM protein [Actinomycetota bacterium]
MINEIYSKSILRKHKKIDSWFLTHYGMNLYRGCTHNCVYCDGCHEKYNVIGEFGQDIEVKVNAIDILKRELDPARKRKTMLKSFILLGGGVCDTYQPAEEKFHLTRKTLELIEKYDYPVHVLTKSILIERDIDLLKRINKKNKVVVSFSFSSTNERISSLFEPGAPSPSRRLEAIKKFKEAGIDCGMFLMPIVPFITDSPEMLDHTLKDAKNAGIDFVVFGTMTLKEGRQKEYFKEALKRYFPELGIEYEKIYPPEHKWGEASHKYIGSVSRIFDECSSRYKIPKRMPPNIYGNILSETDLVIVILEHLDYLNRLKQRKTPYGYAAYNLFKTGKSLKEIGNGLSSIGGIGKAAVVIIKEILDTGTSRQYEDLLFDRT